jgi:hypothetical protein
LLNYRILHMPILYFNEQRYKMKACHNKRRIAKIEKILYFNEQRYKMKACHNIITPVLQGKTTVFQ